ncbi:MAG: sugar transferase [Acidimicrobiales bacterium]|jgi:lipopolysaccharide/colanic/teichoic acid biosynthesis glycosyltransferase
MELGSKAATKHGTASRRSASAYTGGHGVIGQEEFAALGNTSVCQLAVGRTAVGGPAVDLLTDLPTATTWTRPTREAGKDHVGVNRSPRPNDRAAPVPGEPLERYLERRLRQATVLVLPNRTTSFRISKRIVDLVGAIVLLVLTAPIMLVLAALIRLDSKGPALFRQTRVTRGGRTFCFYKFRTMHVDARQRFPDLYNYDFSDGDFDSAYYKLADDPRNTRVGRWLRRTTLDELPNLLNVLKGDLSLVGPRPELPELVRYYQPENLACLFTKAGLTGLAQVAGRSLLTVRERLTLDTRYVANQTFLLDLRILARTVVVVLSGRGAF